MGKYTGKICPYCKTAFQDDDEIVICSSCEMPHHKECWIENQGCTTFGCSGTIQGDSGGPTTVTATAMQYDQPPAAPAFCTSCGAPLYSDAAFCSRCGAPLAAGPASPASSQANPAGAVPYTNGVPPASAGSPEAVRPQPAYPPTLAAPGEAYADPYGYRGPDYPQSGLDPDVVSLIGQRQDYYIHKFGLLKMQDKKVSWNWPAFLVAPFWFMYRKMYGYGFGILAATVLIVLTGLPALYPLCVGGYLVLGLFANWIYLQRIEKIAAQAKTQAAPLKPAYMQEKGGVTTEVPLLTVFGLLILIGIFISL